MLKILMLGVALTLIVARPAIHAAAISADTSQIPSWPEDFKWSSMRKVANYSCILISEPSVTHFRDNYFCWKGNKNLGIEWSYSGSLKHKRCTRINDPSSFNYNDNYLCVDRHLPYHFYWSNNGKKISGKSCQRWSVDTQGWADNYLCAVSTNNTLPDPIFPDDFKWDYHGKPTGYDCIHVYEPQSGRSWENNFLCWKDTTRNPGITWSYHYLDPDMRCTSFYEPGSLGWHDNYLCVPKTSDLRLTWHNSGAPKDRNCIRIDEPGEPHSWNDNFLCEEKCKLNKIEILNSEDVRGVYEGAQVIGVVSGGSCIGTGEHKVSISSTDSVTETVSMTLSEESSINWSITASVEIETKVEFFGSGVSFKAGISTGIGGSHSIGKSQSKSTSTEQSNTVGHETAYSSPGAAILFGMVDRYKIDRQNTPIKVHLQCRNGEPVVKESTMNLQATTYQSAHFEGMVGTFTKDACDANRDLPVCVRSLPYQYNLFFGDMEKVRQGFLKCFDGDVSSMKYI